MKNIRIADMTLSENAGIKSSAMSFKEKIETARLLDKLKADVIHLPEIKDKKTDSLLVRTIAMTVKNAVLCVEAGIADESIALAADSIKQCEKSRLSVSIPVSAVQMEYALAKKPDKVLEIIGEAVKKCRALRDDVEFIALDATRAEEDFLLAAASAAEKAGASNICLCDTAGAILPDECALMINKVKGVSGKAKISAMFDNGLDMASANSLSALKAGADEIKTSAAGITAVSIKKLSHALSVKGDAIGVKTRLNTTQLNKVMEMMTWINKAGHVSAAAVSSSDNEKETSALYDSSTDITALSKWIKKRGYDLSDEDLAKVYESFAHTASKKKVSAREIDAMVASNALQVTPTYKLVSYVINSGNIINATADITLENDGERVCGLMSGDGPIDASFRAIEQIAGHHFELDDFQIQSVTEGREAMGEALVKLRHNGSLYSGKGISTDIIGASIRAYLSALNKIVYEEKA